MLPKHLAYPIIQVKERESVIGLERHKTHFQNALVERVIVLDGRARGVRFQRKNRIGLVKHHNVFARREVVMSAGAVATPQILMLSGIGPKHHLQGSTP